MKKFLATILSVILLLTIIPMAYAEENTEYKVGDIVQFGSYPQSEVTDETLIAELNSLAPEWDEWTSYGYYSGNGELGSMVQGDWMRYTDITYNGSKYRGVKFTQYRPYYTFGYSESNSYQDDNGYFLNSIYWFKFDSIKWRVLDTKIGLVVCETIIDSQPYSNTIYYQRNKIDWRYEYFNDYDYTNYASDYETSSIRQWLNDDFYNTAFTDVEKEKIDDITLDNYGIYSGEAGYEDLDSNRTTDKIFLLSNAEDSEYYRYRETVGTHNSNYAECQGLWLNRNKVGNGFLLRSPGDSSSFCCHAVYDALGTRSVDAVYYTYYGICPALVLNTVISAHSHKYTTIKTPPTCTEKGYTTYTCACGDSYISDYVNALGHKDNNGDYKCDNGCGYEFEKPAPEEPSKDCSCNCHKGGIMGFFWKIINFFNKLFKSKQYCGCGAKHW